MWRKRRARPAEPEIDWRLCERIAALPETAFSPDEIKAQRETDLLLDLAPEQQNAILDMLERWPPVPEPPPDLRSEQLDSLWAHFTIDERHRVLHAFWNSLSEPHRRRLQIELGIGSPWPHNDFVRADGAVPFVIRTPGGAKPSS